MSQNTAIRTTGTRWDFLEPAMNPNHARTKHCVLVAAGSGLYVRYPKGQVICQKNDGTNVWAKYGTAGYNTSICMIVKQPVLVNDAGDWQLTDQVTPIYGETWMRGSIDAFYQGYFRCEDVVSAGGTNEVQTETLDAGVDGGSRKLTFGAYQTAAIAWNANAAAIKAAMLLAIPTLTTADITVAGSGPYTYTFSGAYAGSNVPMIVVDPALLTDGGVAPATTGSVITQTTPGAGLLTGVGRLISGTSSVGIFELGAATPV